MVQYLIMFYKNITDGISPYKVVGYKLFLCTNIYLIFGKIIEMQNVWINVIPKQGTLLLNSTYMGLFSFKNCLFRYLSFINFFCKLWKKRLIKTSLFGYNSGVASLYMSHRFLSFMHLRNYHGYISYSICV